MFYPVFEYLIIIPLYYSKHNTSTIKRDRRNKTYFGHYRKIILIM